MTYTVIIAKSVQKQIEALPREIGERVVEKLVQLKDNPRPMGAIKLKGFSDEYRIRIGDYRVRYEVNNEVRLIQILQCKHRRDVYR